MIQRNILNDCGSDIDEAACMRAKDIIKSEGCVGFPATYASVGSQRKLWRESGMIHIGDVDLEHKISPQIRPDLFVTYPGGSLVIEISVMHKCTPEKGYWLRANKIPAFEINLRAYRRSDLGDRFRNAVLRQAPRSWIYNPHQSEADAALMGRLEGEWNARQIEEFKDATPRSDMLPAPPRHPAVIAYEARLCYVCGCSSPMFGFGSPLTETEAWACVAHHVEVGQALEARRGA